MYQVAQQVIEMPWPRDIAERFSEDTEPIILIIDRA